MSEKQLKAAIIAMGVWKTLLEPIFAIFVIAAISYWVFRARTISVCAADTRACASICTTVHGRMQSTSSSDTCATSEPIRCVCSIR